MDSFANTHRSLIFRVSQSSHEKGVHSHQDSLTPVENFIPKSLKKSLLTPHGRINTMVKTITEQVTNGRLPAAKALQLFGILRRAIRFEQESIKKQLQDRKHQGKAFSMFSQMAIATWFLGQAVDNCMASLHEGGPSDFREAIAYLQKIVHEHEQMMENWVSTSETEGWILLQRFPGPFSPIVSVLGWGITMYLAGLLPEQSFRKLLDMLKKELQEIANALKPNLFFMLSWKQAEVEAGAAFQLVCTTLLNKDAIASGIVDPASLRGSLGSLAKALCQLNILAACFHPEKSKEIRGFSSKVLVFLNRKNRTQHVMDVKPDFYPKAVGMSAN